MIAPLTELTKKEIDNSVGSAWGPEQEAAFDAVKRSLTKECMLYYPDWNQGFTLRTDASSVGVGAILLQAGRPICFWMCPLRWLRLRVLCVRHRHHAAPRFHGDVGMNRHIVVLGMKYRYCDPVFHWRCVHLV